MEIIVKAFLSGRKIDVWIEEKNEMDFEFSKLNDRELYQFYLEHEDDEELCERIEKIERFVASGIMA